MRFLLAPNAFKGSLTAAAVAEAMARGVREACPHAHTHCLPLADGGDGTLAALMTVCEGQWHSVEVHGPLGSPVIARWGLLRDGSALIELAQAAGLALVTPAERDVWRSSTFGVGQLMRAALDAGARKMVLALGGSATQDGGAGMLQALGADLRDGAGRQLPPGGGALPTLARIDLAGLDARLAKTSLAILCDVDTPLCGPGGSAAVYGPQKGAESWQVAQLDAALGHFADIVAVQTGQDFRHQAGSGAAGGTAFAACSLLGGQMVSGFEWVAGLTGLSAAIDQADVVFTGEGRLDGQTLAGKVPAGVLALAKPRDKPVIAFAGELSPGYEALHPLGLTAAYAIAPGPATLAESTEFGALWLQRCSRNVARTLTVLSERAFGLS